MTEKLGLGLDTAVVEGVELIGAHTASDEAVQAVVTSPGHVAQGEQAGTPVVSALKVPAAHAMQVAEEVAASEALYAPEGHAVQPTGLADRPL